MSSEEDSKKPRTIAAAVDKEYLGLINYLKGLGYTDSVIVRRGIKLLYDKEHTAASTKNKSEVTIPQ